MLVLLAVLWLFGLRIPFGQRIDPIDRIRRRSRRQENGCLEYMGARSHNGYGVIQVQEPRPKMAVKVHRLVWEAAHGPIPVGMLVCHHCDNPPCVELDHLFLGTHTDNMRDALSKQRLGRMSKGCCRAGHPYTEETTVYITTGGRRHRRCRVCHRLAMARYTAKKRSA